MENITTELGQASGIRRKIAATRWGKSRATFESMPTDLNADLNFPNCLPIYADMMNSAKIGGILESITLRITGMTWALTGDKVRPEVMAYLQEQFGMTESSEGRVRHHAAGVNLYEHLADALTCLAYGFAPFEQVYSVGAPVTPVEKALGLRWITRMRKLGHRDPATISAVGVGADGGLVDIVQRVTGADGIMREVSIPVDRLVVYTNGRKGGDWYGKSVLRRAYRDWYFMDMFERLHAQIIERNGMGFPTMEYDPAKMTREQAMEVVRSIRAGEEVGAAWPFGGGKFALNGVSGSLVDPLPAIQRHEQSIGKALLAMVMDLGHDAGARSLGDTFQALFDSALNAFADRFAETFTEHVIADLVALNFGPSERYPTLTHGSAEGTIGADADTLKILSEAGFITPQREDESALRAKLGMPEVAAAAAEPDQAMSAEELLQRVNAASALIRSGYDPMDSLKNSGLPTVQHLGLLPVTVQRPDTTDGAMPDGDNIPPAEDEGAPPAAGLSADDGVSADLLARAARLLGQAGA